MPAEVEGTPRHAPSAAPSVHLDSAALAASGVQVGTAREVDAGALVVTGDVTYDQGRVSHVGPRTQGRVVEIGVQVGSRVREGEVLAHLESAEVGEIRADLDEAEALLTIAQENHERERRLEARGISSRRELLDAQGELRRVEARLQSARERLRVLGADAHGDGGHFDVVSPYTGVVVAGRAGLGEVVGPADPMFTVADLSRLWIQLDVYERNLARVAEGQPVEVITPAWPDRVFPGRIVYVGDVVAPDSRTIRARVEVENEDRALKPGMFVTARIGMTDDPCLVAIPRDAVQQMEGREGLARGELGGHGH
jgi:cobalt-zinc-cadmium efflux system membrane fusion protein